MNNNKRHKPSYPASYHYYPGDDFAALVDAMRDEENISAAAAAAREAAAKETAPAAATAAAQSRKAAAVNELVKKTAIQQRSKSRFLCIVF